jgi:hypothetical protein
MEATKKGERVRSSSSAAVNRKIDREIIESLEYYAQHPDKIEGRIRELDREWDIERTLELNAATLALTGSLLTKFVDKRWLLMPVVVTTFLVQHAIQGWCPPILLFRKMSIRTRPEIDREKYALKALRGDFRNVTSVQEAWHMVN